MTLSLAPNLAQGRTKIPQPDTPPLIIFRLRAIRMSNCDKRKAGKIQSIVLLVVGLFMIIGSSIAAGLQFKRQQEWISTTGTIVGTEYCSAGDTGGSSAIIQYETSAERTYTFTSSLCSSGDPPSVGADIAVLYNPEDPSNAMDASFVNAWLFQIIFGVLGLVSFVGSGFHLYRMRGEKDINDEPSNGNAYGRDTVSNAFTPSLQPTATYPPTATTAASPPTTLDSMLKIDIPMGDVSHQNGKAAASHPVAEPEIYVSSATQWKA